MGAADESDAPLTPDEFATLMARLGPLERRPRLAVATSGGPDSVALCLLADGWVRARGGGTVGLTVDHGLRPESTAEAATVAGWLAARGIAHAVLPWRGPKPAAGVQAAARRARYELLGGWCRAHGVLHLLLAHHRDDQAETFLLRRARGSGPDGLAGMAAVREVEGLRLLRPLLPVSKARLRATLAALGQPWIEDPSNLDPAFTRTRLRRRPAADNAALAEAAHAYGLRRREADGATAAALARWARPHPAGFVEVDRRCFTEAGPEIARRVLERILGAVGGRAYPPRGGRLAGLLRALCGREPFTGRTLHGCRVLPWGSRLLICREPAAIGGPVVVEPGATAVWDGRFRVRYRAGEAPLTVRALRAAARRIRPATSGAAVPAPVRPGLPSLWRVDRLVAVPHFEVEAAGTMALRVELIFRPSIPLAGPPFAANGVASGWS